MSDGPPTGDSKMPDALNKVFHVNNMLEDIGGLVDPEDLPEGSSSTGRNDKLDSDRVDNVAPAKKKFVTSHPGTDQMMVALALVAVAAAQHSR